MKTIEIGQIFRKRDMTDMRQWHVISITDNAWVVMRVNGNAKGDCVIAHIEQIGLYFQSVDDAATLTEYARLLEEDEQEKKLQADVDRLEKKLADASA